jgi:hypothetical protein
MINMMTDIGTNPTLVKPDLLIKGERQLGDYQVQIARLTSSGWVPTIPPLRAVVTNYRLILQPQTRKPYTPASIPGSYITKVCDIALGHHKGVLVALKTGHNLNMFVSWSKGYPLTQAVKDLLVPSTRTQFESRLAQQDLVRLIECISGV